MKRYEPLIIQQSIDIPSLTLTVNCEGVFRVRYHSQEKYNGLDYAKAIREYSYWEAWVLDEIDELNRRPTHIDENFKGDTNE